LTLVQCRKAKPVPIILYVSEFWHSLINFNMLADLGTISEQDLDLLRFVDSPQEAWGAISEFYNL
ncbi:MAG: LOG family protein, partial [Burkholderiaceae bacterium]